MKPDDQAVIAALQTLTWNTDGTVGLPPLDPDTYAGVKRVLSFAGITWHRGPQVHRFTGNPAYARARIEQIIAGGKLPKTNPLQFFPTPPALAAGMAQHAVNQVGWMHDLRRIRVLEPSAGEGALISAFMDAYPSPGTVDLVACEFDPQRHDDLLTSGVNVAGHDFLAYRANEPFDLILMNPPFNLPGDARAWESHVLHAWELLAENGTLVAIIPAGPQVDGSRIWDAIAHQYLSLDTHPAGSFKTSGTSVPTQTLTVCKEDQSWRVLPCNLGHDIYPSWHAAQLWLAAYNDWNACWEQMQRRAERARAVADVRKDVQRGFGSYARHLRQFSVNITLSPRDLDFLYMEFCGYYELPHPEWILTPAESAREQQVLADQCGRGSRWKRLAPAEELSAEPPSAAFPNQPSVEQLIRGLPFVARPTPQPVLLPADVHSTLPGPPGPAVQTSTMPSLF